MNLESKSRGTTLTEPEAPIPSKIRVVYGGLFSDRMNWNREVIDQFAAASDLRTQVIIQSSDQRERFNTVVLGDTLALKRRVPTIVPRQKRDELVEVHSNFPAGVAYVTIRDQDLLQRDLQRRDHTHPEEFVKNVNKLVKKGLRRLVFEEKKYQATTAVKIDSELVGSGLITAFSYFLAESSTYDVVRGAGVDVGGSYWSLTFLKLLMLYSFMEMTTKSVKWLNESTDKNYIATVTDLLPPKHLAKIPAGAVNLLSNGVLVSYKVPKRA
ncbi:MAG TPA: hypothetical protein VKC89_00875 [Patescibacteria group bacterium]|nr:hypothetical protein [Patescibacteria group bacterium]